MIIVIDYDNDQIRIGPNENKNNMINFKVSHIGEFRPVLIEIINMICDGNDHPFISLVSQDEGEMHTIEEY